MSLPTFQGPVFNRGDANYQIHAYQYGTSTYDPTVAGDMAPGAIVYLQPGTADSDIELAINYAIQADVAIAVRTGGHQYSGASSTSGQNIQLDISEAFFDFDLTSRPGYLVAGVSHKLIDFATLLHQNDMFLPMGQCSHVHLGGHMQSGGYGQMSRSFGLLGDHVVGFEIWTADGPGPQKRTVMRDSPAPADVDLFFAVLGGSPGNFGIVTRVILKPLLDADYPHSRGLRIVAPYNYEALKNLYALMVDFVQTNESGIDFSITATAATTQYLADALGEASYDSYMKYNYPEEFGRDPNDPLSDLSAMVWPSLNVYVQSSNLGGASEPYNPEFCNKVRAAMEPCGFWQLPLQNDDVHVPISKLNFQWIYSGVREFDYPYVKNGQVSTQTTFPGWAEFAAGYVDTIQQQQQQGLMVFTQCQYFGGYNSAYKKNNDGKTAYSWRDATIGINFDIFYDLKTSADALALANSYQAGYTAKAIGPGGLFSQQDLRWFWATHGDRDLSKVWQCYLSPASYQRLLQIKKTYDPQSVFSPNAFCVGGAKPPSKPRAVRLMKEKGAAVDDKVNVAKLRAAAAAGQARSKL
jgi:FAD/FMN-containing dehydrogenase